MQKSFDKIADSGVPCLHLLNTGDNAATAPVRSGIFLSPAWERVPGCVGNIANTHGSSLSLCSTSRHFAESLEQETMLMCTCPKCDTHQEDALNITRYKLALLTDLLCKVPDTRATDISGPAITGLYWILREAEEACTAVLNTSMEV